MTSETKTNHTPGPWIWGPNARLYADPTLSECQRVMNVRLGKTTALCWDDRDARLISAAPDMLYVLQAIAADIENRARLGLDPPAWYTRARAAIDKATG